MPEVNRIAEQREKARQRAAEWRRKNPERAKRTPERRERDRQSALRYYYEHREESIRKKAEWNREHPEKKREYDRRSYERRREPIRLRRHRYYEQHKAEIAAKTVEWQKRNPERFRTNNRASDSTKRARRYQVSGRITGNDIRDLLRQQNEKCAICQEPFPPVGVRNRYQIDHIIALVAGGPNERSNIQLLCSKCNKRKGGRTISRYQDPDTRVQT
jgi:5-methylcytosine-specific restriction endonuclease McrA